MNESKLTIPLNMLSEYVEMKAKIAELERENKNLWEVTSMIGAPEHIGIPRSMWRSLRKDKERLDWIISNAPTMFFMNWCSDLVKGRRQIDAARREAQP